jgi:hypothetical protein
MAEYKPQFTIERTEKFIQNCNELSKIYGRLTDLINAVDWVLSRHPHLYKQIVSNYYLFKSSQLSNREFPKLKIMYIIHEDLNKVTLMDIEDDV